MNEVTSPPPPPPRPTPTNLPRKKEWNNKINKHKH